MLVLAHELAFAIPIALRSLGVAHEHATVPWHAALAEELTHGLAEHAHQELHLPVSDEQHAILLKPLEQNRSGRSLMGSAHHVLIVALELLGRAAYKLLQLSHGLKPRLRRSGREQRERHELLLPLKAHIH